MEERDQTPIPYVLQDRLNLQSANDNLKTIGRAIDEMSALMTEHIKVQHAKIDEELSALEDVHKVEAAIKRRRWATYKIVAGIIALIGTLAGIATALHIL